MKKLAPMLSEITLFRVAGNLKFVAEGTRNTAVKHTENAALAASADTIAQVVLGGFEFMKVIQISRTAALMSVGAFEDWLVEMLAGDIARAIDDYIINDASNGIAALTYTTGTNQILNTATTGYTYANVCDLIALLPAAYDTEAKFLVNKKTLYSKIAQIVDSAKHPIFVPDTVNGIGGTLMGYPVVVDDFVGTTDNALYLGKWTDVVGNLPEDITVDRDESAGFTANAVVYRGISVFDSKPAKGDAIVRLVSTAS
jgi:HK97 family phage major capsid protein